MLLTNPDVYKRINNSGRPSTNLKRQTKAHCIFLRKNAAFLFKITTSQTVRLAQKLLISTGKAIKQC
jgi:hypothetical protein